MIKSTSILITAFSALFIACAVAGASASPAAAQTAKKLKCNGCVKSKQLKNGQVRNADLGSNAVTGNKIADGAVGSADLANNAVTSGKIADGAVGNDDLAVNAVTSDRIADGAVGNAELADNAVTSDKIADGSLSSSDLSDAAGGDFIEANQTFPLSSGFQRVRQVTVTAPASGLVVVTASGTFEFAETAPTAMDQVQCSVTTGATGSNVEQFSAGEATNDQEILWLPFSSTRGFVVAPGDTAFNLNCSGFSGTVNVLNSMMTAVFVPIRY